MAFFDSNPVGSFLERKFYDRRLLVLWCCAAISMLVMVIAIYAICVRPPAAFPVRTIIIIKENAGLNEIVKQMYDMKVIRSPLLLRTAVIFKSGQRGVLAGNYYFEHPVGVFDVASRLTRGLFGLTPLRVTLTEGMTVSQMAVVLEDRLIDFDTNKFLELAKPKEGYLFPDTYLFLPNAKPADVIDILENNFADKIKSIDDKIKVFNKPIKDVVIMASILEAEARTTETRKIIAGILWKRLVLGMPLQVDAPFQYIIGKNTFQLTVADLQYDSPYNTYKYKGLPLGAIGNPGLDALVATVTPIKTPHLFYLSDIRGNMHYAKTFEEHVLNKEKYLR